MAEFGDRAEQEALWRRWRSLARNEDEGATQPDEIWLASYAEGKLGEINSLRIIGRAPGKGAIISFEMKSAHAHDFATVLDRSGIAVRAGTHCAMPLLKRFGVSATCRASFALYNTLEEVDVLVRALSKAQEFFA